MKIDRFELDGSLVAGMFTNIPAMDGCLLNGLVYYYKKTKETAVKDILVSYGNTWIDKDGSLKSIEDAGFAKFYAGNLLYFLYEETKDEKYRKAIESIKTGIEKKERTENGTICVEKTAGNLAIFCALSNLLPFYMRYETTFHKKENYNDVMLQFNNIRDSFFDESSKLYLKEEASVTDMAWFALSLAQTIEATSEEIYEQYHTLQAMLRETVKGLLAYEKLKKADASALFMLSAAMTKGCRERALLTEKYETKAEELRLAALGLVDEKQLLSDSVLLGAMTMAYTV
ncbi:MAG: hypothetical protein E7256_14260 [Lachnospiraceae bacterium]|nr:hypothetical protein [Lachnospiraceae bacterium]